LVIVIEPNTKRNFRADAIFLHLLLGLARTSGWNRSGFFFTAAMKRFVLKGSKGTDRCFTAAIFQTQHALFSGRWQWNTSEHTCLRTRAANNSTATSLPFQVNAHIMNLDFKIFYDERLITEVEKRPALYN
jgi:hypothetical protein